MLLYELQLPSNLTPAEAAALRQSRRVKPELSTLILALDMNMRRFIAVA